MTGNQYFIVIIAGVLAYFIINIVNIHVKHKKEVWREQESIRIHQENMKQLDIIRGVIRDKCK